MASRAVSSALRAPPLPARLPWVPLPPPPCPPPLPGGGSALVFSRGPGFPLPLFRFARLLFAVGKNSVPQPLALRANWQCPFVFPTAPFRPASLPPSPCSACAPVPALRFALSGYRCPRFAVPPGLRPGRAVFSRGAGVSPSPSFRFARLSAGSAAPFPLLRRGPGKPSVRFAPGGFHCPRFAVTPVLRPGRAVF